MTNITGPISDVDIEWLHPEVQHRLFMNISDKHNPQPFERGSELIHESIIPRRRVLRTPTCSFAVMT